MKKTFINLAHKIFLPVVALMMIVSMHVPVAEAAWSFNNDPRDCRTVTIANATTGQGYTSNECWNSTSISAGKGDTFNVAIYYHNTGTTAASDVSLRIDDITGTKSGSVSVRGQIYVGGTAVSNVNGTVSVNVPSGSEIEFVGAEMVTNSNRTPRSLSNADNIMEGPHGLNIGTVNAGGNYQGVVKAIFKIAGDSDGGSNGTFDVTTDNVSDLDEDQGDVTLNGHYEDNDSTHAYTRFEYKRNNGSTTVTSWQDHGSDEADSFSVDLNNLSDGDYDYRACGKEGTNGSIECGSWKEFSIGDDSNDDNDQALNTTTDSADDVDENSAKLRGNVEAGDNDIDECWFEYGTSSGNLNKTKSVSCSIDSDDNEDISATISGLNDDEEYFFRACAEDSSGQEDCGTTKSFETDRENSNDDEDDEERPDIETLSYIQKGTTFATLDSHYQMNGCSGDTWFEYGRSNSFGSQTNRVAHSGSSAGYSNQTITGLSSNTVYYYRAAGKNCNGTTYGSTRSFTTDRTTTVINNGGGTTIVRNTVTTVGGGSSLLKLTIDNNQDTVVRGEILSYDVTWENISGRDLTDLVLEVSFPDGLQIVRTDRGQIDRADNAVYVNINELDKGDKDDMTINARVVGNLRDNDPVTARAIIAFENPINQAQENAIAYDSDTYLAASSVLGASIFGLDFLPGTLAGWLFIILLIILLLLVVRYALGRRRDDDRPHGGNGGNYVAPTPAPTAGTTYSESADYTPYRPTPRG